MVSETYKCPVCDVAEPVIRFGFNRGGTQRLRCKACGKTWTPKARSRQLSPEKEALIEAALGERLSQRAIARTFKVARSTTQHCPRGAQKKSQAARLSFADTLLPALSDLSLIMWTQKEKGFPPFADFVVGKLLQTRQASSNPVTNVIVSDCKRLRCN